MDEKELDSPVSLNQFQFDENDRYKALIKQVYHHLRKSKKGVYVEYEDDETFSVISRYFLKRNCTVSTVEKNSKKYIAIFLPSPPPLVYSPSSASTNKVDLSRQASSPSSLPPLQDIESIDLRTLKMMFDRNVEQGKRKFTLDAKSLNKEACEIFVEKLRKQGHSAELTQGIKRKYLIGSLRSFKEIKVKLKK